MKGFALTLGLLSVPIVAHRAQEQAVSVAEDPDLERVRVLLEATENALEGGSQSEARGYVDEAGRLVADRIGRASLEWTELARELDGLAARLRSTRVQLAARELIVAYRAARREPTDLGLLKSRLNLGATRLALGEFEGGLELLVDVHAKMEAVLPPDDRALLIAKQNLAIARKRTGDYEGALALEELVHEASSRTLPPDHAELLRAKTNLAITKKGLDDLEGALELEQHVHDEHAKALPEGHPLLLRAKQNLAITKKKIGDWDGAVALEEYALLWERRQLPDDHLDVTSAKSNLAVTLHLMGHLERSLALKEEVCESYERTLDADHPRTLAAKANLAVTRKSLGDLRGALALEEQVYAAYRRLLPPEHPSMLAAMRNLGDTRSGMNDVDGALELHEAVLTLAEEYRSEDSSAVLGAKLSLASTKRLRGDYEGALALNREVYEAQREELPPHHPALLATQWNLSTNYYVLGDYERARELSEHVHATALTSLPIEHPRALGFRIGLAALRFQREGPERAAELLPDFFAGAMRMLEGALLTSPREARAVAWSETNGAWAALFLAGDGFENELFDLFETRRHVATASRATGTREALAGLEDLRHRWSALSRELGELVSSGGEVAPGAASLRDELTRVSRQRDRIQREYFSLLRSRSPFVEAVEANALRSRLPEGAIAVGFSRYHRWNDQNIAEPDPSDNLHYLAFVLTKDGDPQRVELGPASEIEDLVIAWRASIDKPLKAEIDAELAQRPERELGEALRGAVLDPVLERAGDPNEGATIYVCPDAALHLIALDALPWKGSRGRVGDRYAIRTEVSFARLLAKRGANETQPSLLAIGDVDFGGEIPNATTRSATTTAAWSQLAGTREELETLAALFKGHFGTEALRLRRADATKEALFELAPGKRWLHVATHGWFAPERFRAMGDGVDRVAHRSTLAQAIEGFAPMALAGLCFAGANSGRPGGSGSGLLTAEELSGVDLSSCELAVLSACDTNVGVRQSGLGVQSLQAALHAAGARAAITSLWKVEDAATQELMRLFYEAYWVEGQPKADALWRAKRRLRERRYPVRDWAGWVLTGDPR